MPNARRRFIANSNVLITSRIKTGLPLACNPLIELIIKSVLARALALFPVKISHFIFMANHFHIILYVQDPLELVNFIAFVKKRLSDFINKLTGKIGSRWQVGFDALIILDNQKALDKILYIYNNPVKAGLVESIEDYPGVSSFGSLSTDAEAYQELVPKVKIKDIPCLRNNKLSLGELKLLVKKLSKPEILKHTLKIFPYIWAKSYGETKSLSNLEIQKLILDNLKIKELEYAKERKLKKQSVLGAVRLQKQSIFKKHKPKAFGKRMLCLSVSISLRKKYINDFREFCKKASIAYQKLKAGALAVFPLGCFRPCAPPVSTCLNWV
jgi:REP element-mobilizing transposase RayT